MGLHLSHSLVHLVVAQDDFISLVLPRKERERELGQEACQLCWLGHDDTSSILCHLKDGQSPPCLRIGSESSDPERHLLAVRRPSEQVAGDL